MIEEKLSRSEILKRIAEKKITAKEGLSLLNENKSFNEVKNTDSHSVTKTYEGWWEESELILNQSVAFQENENQRNHMFNNMILFDYNGEIRNAFIADPELEASPVILVTPGEKFYKFDAYTYEINPSDKADYERLFENLLEEKILPERIVHLWAKEQFHAAEPNVRNQLEVSFYSLLFITQTLLQLKIKNQLKVLFIYNTRGKTEPLYEAVSGFAKTIHLENPNYKFKVIAVDMESTAFQEENNNPNYMLKIITGELLSDQSETEINYNGDRRFIRKFREIQLPNLQESGVPVKKKGTYIITGGAGGIGRIIARYLAETFHGNIVLTGRTILNDSQKQGLEELKRLGADVVYIRSDLRKEEDIDYLLKECRAKFGQINGIFHCAGVLNDTLALNKKKETIEEVFGPKIYGSVYLSEKLKGYPLDFIVFFSGLASIFGNVGQIDYSYANAFVDNYALYLAKEFPDTRIRAINWPLWENGGMQIEQQQKEWLLENYGMRTINDEKGMEVLLRALNSPYEQVIVVQAEAEKHKVISGLLNEEKKAAEPPKADGVITSYDLSKAIEIYLKKVLSAELKLAEGSFNPGEPWEKYGINSMSIVKMTNQIEKDFGPISKTLFFEYQNLHELVQYFEENYKEIILDKLLHNNQAASISNKATAPIQEKHVKEEKILGKNRFFNVPVSSNDANRNVVSNYVNRNNPSRNNSNINDTSSNTTINSNTNSNITNNDITRNINMNGNILNSNIPNSNKINSNNTNSNNTNNNNANSNNTNNNNTNSNNINSTRNDDDIAVIGISGKYPMAENLEEFWENLKKGIDCITEIPPKRWDYQKYYSKEKGIKSKAYSKWGGFLSDYDMFDPLFFGITPRDAEMMDPQERLFLEVTWEAMEDAGYNLEKLKKYEIGVYVGVMYGHYQMFGAEETLYGNPMALSSSYASIANRVSYTFDLTGPSIAIDTMCSSSLTTIHLACESIHRGECQMAVAGGVNLTIHPTKHQYLCANNFASTDGRCRSFGEGGDGYVPGEGVGALLLKSLSQAEADGDHIYAVIRGSSINHGGRTNGYTVPNPKKQSDLIVKTLEKAHINPRTISYLEAHGTGTSLGDPIEITGLTKSFTKYTKEKQYCAIGSVKSNIGHAEAAAGIAGITKIILQMKHKQLVPSLHSEITNPNIDFENTPFYVQRSCSKWVPPTIEIDGEVKKCPRIAGISAFGAGGSNAHIILEEYVEKEQAADQVTAKPQLIILSARNKDRLKQYAKALCLHLENAGSQPEAGDSAIPWVRSIVCELIAELIQVEALEIDNEGVFSEMNLDMVKLNLLVERINQKLNVDLSVREVLQNPSVDSTASYLYSKYPKQLKKYSQSGDKQETGYIWTQQINMRDLAYTLQTGREEKDYRLAVIAAEGKELHEKLRDYMNDRNETFSFITGSAVEKKELFKEDSLDSYITESIQNENLIDLAKLWVTGTKIDWNLLYGEIKPKVMSLPVYPFEKKRYWYNSFQKKPEAEDRMLKESSLKESSQVAIPDTQSEAVPNGFETELDFKYAESNYKGNEVSLQVIDESIALITMQDEKNRNMFAENLVLGLMAKFAQVKKDPRITSIIVTGYGNIFSMGGTQEQLLNIANQKNSFTDAPFLYRGLLEAPVPVITAIQGHAAGGGLLFGLFGDIVIMAKEGIYSAVFAKYGFTPGMGATYILKEKFGINLSSEMMYTAKSYSGEELFQKGAKVTFTNSKDVLKEALNIARSLSEKPLITLKILKSNLSGRILRELPEYIRQENLMHRQTFTNPEVKERIRHFYLEDKDFNGALKPGGEKKVTVDNKIKLAAFVDLPETENKYEDVSAAALDNMLEALEAGEITPEEAVLFRQRDERII